MKNYRYSRTATQVPPNLNHVVQHLVEAINTLHTSKSTGDPKVDALMREAKDLLGKAQWKFMEVQHLCA